MLAEGISLAPAAAGTNRSSCAQAAAAPLVIVSISSARSVALGLAPAPAPGSGARVDVRCGARAARCAVSVPRAHELCRGGGASPTGARVTFEPSARLQLACL